MANLAAVPSPPGTRFTAIAADLRQRGWSVQRDFLTPGQTAVLRDELLLLADADRLCPAGIGRDRRHRLRPDIRGDRIRWLDGGSAAQRGYLRLLERLRLSLNRSLFLGLDDLECHFAWYPPGSGYRRHLDSFRCGNLRRVSTVVYLNDDWQACDRGQLQLYRGRRLIETVLPEAGTLVCFLSDETPHAVAATRRPRMSIAGWFRIRPASGTLPPARTGIGA
jgi:SM-20-related protein